VHPRVRASTLPGGDYITLLHVGPYRSDSLPDLGDARAELVAWADENEVASRKRHAARNRVGLRARAVRGRAGR